MRHRACRRRSALLLRDLWALPSRGWLPGNWTYTTVIARTRSGQPLAVEANEESNELRWVPLGEVEKLPLLGAFRQAFPALLKQIEGLRR